MNQQEIAFYEELQTNAFPALQTLMYDGWSVRFGGGFTYRVNCANPMYPESLPAAEKIEYVEGLYQSSGLGRAIFKLHDGMDPRQRDACQTLLDGRGYATERDGNIFVRGLDASPGRTNAQVTVERVMTDGWLDGFLTMNGTSDSQRAAAVRMLKSIAMPIAAASVVEQGKMVACGLGVLERGHVGMYDIFVDEACRRRGLGRDICTAIMNDGARRGCDTAYLQVLSDNFGARAMYDQLGFAETYEYWFRIKKL